MPTIHPHPDISMDLHDEYRAALAIRHTPGIGPRSWRRIARAYHSLTEACRDARAWSTRRLARKASTEAFLNRVWREPAEAELRAFERGAPWPIRAAAWNDPLYPGQLKEIVDPPLYLYHTGRMELAAGPCVALVGARRCSRYGLDMAWEVGQALSAAGVSIASGMALGIDRQAHLAGLSGSGSSVAVLGTGLDQVYPAANRDVFEQLVEQGAVISEFAPGTRADQHTFPVRNRIISGLSLGVVVAEADLGSGSIITARLATEQGREVFAVPGLTTMPGYRGCHALLRDGATLIRGAEDVLEALAAQLAETLARNPTPQTARQMPLPGAESATVSQGSEADKSPEEMERPEGAEELDAAEAALWALLVPGDKLHIDHLGRGAGLKGGEISRALVSLEVRGLVRQWPGMFYSRARA